MAQTTDSNSQMPTRTLGRTARRFKPMTEEQVKALLAKTTKAAARGEFELFKTTSVYDGTASHPEWLGEEPPEVQARCRFKTIRVRARGRVARSGA